MNIAIPVIAVVAVVEEDTGMAVDESGMGCVIAKRERDQCDLFHFFNM